MPIVVGALAPVLAGFLALLIIVGALLLIELVVRVIDTMLNSYFLSRFRARIDLAIAQTLSALWEWLWGAATGAISFIVSLPRSVGLMIEAAEAALWSHALWIRALAFGSIPNLWRSLSAGLDALRGYLLRVIGDAINNAFSYIGALRSVLLMYISQVFDRAISYAELLYRVLLNVISTSIASVRAYALSLFTAVMSTLSAWVTVLAQAIADLQRNLTAFVLRMADWAVQTAFQAAISWAKAYADQLVGLLERALVAACAAVLAPTYPRILDIIDALARAWPGSLAGLLPRLGVIPRALPRTLAGLLSLIAAIGAIALDWIRECGIPLCNRLGALGWALDGLQDELLILDILELVETAVRDPQGSAHDTAEVISTQVSIIADGVYESLGLK